MRRIKGPALRDDVVKDLRRVGDEVIAAPVVAHRIEAAETADIDVQPHFGAPGRAIHPMNDDVRLDLGQRLAILPPAFPIDALGETNGRCRNAGRFHILGQAAMIVMNGMLVQAAFVQRRQQLDVKTLRPPVRANDELHDFHSLPVT
jgi:hypothetical protein